MYLKNCLAGKIFIIRIYDGNYGLALVSRRSYLSIGTSCIFIPWFVDVVNDVFFIFRPLYLSLLKTIEKFFNTNKTNFVFHNKICFNPVRSTIFSLMIKKSSVANLNNFILKKHIRPEFLYSIFLSYLIVLWLNNSIISIQKFLQKGKGFLVKHDLCWPHCK